MKWVKASQKMPNIIGYYCCKINGGFTGLWIRCRKDGVKVFVDSGGFLVRKTTIEWLDESETTKEEKV